MRSPAPILFGKVVPPEGDVVDGIFVPGGTTIGHNFFPMLRAREHWGDDAAVFRPERFMEVDTHARASMERLVDLVFGYGRYGCAGKPLAFMELNKVFFEVSGWMKAIATCMFYRLIGSSFSAISISSLSTQQGRGTLSFAPSLWRVISWSTSPKHGVLEVLVTDVRDVVLSFS